MKCSGPLCTAIAKVELLWKTQDKEIKLLGGWSPHAHKGQATATEVCVCNLVSHK